MPRAGGRSGKRRKTPRRRLVETALARRFGVGHGRVDARTAVVRSAATERRRSAAGLKSGWQSLIGEEAYSLRRAALRIVCIATCHKVTHAGLQLTVVLT